MAFRFFLASPRRWPAFASRLAAGGSALVLVLSAPSAVAAQRAAPDTLAERTLACTACHGKEGRATAQGYFPRIAGKPAGYLVAQLLNFREGRRENAVMTSLIEHLPDAYLAEIAGHFAALELPYPPPPPPDAPPAVLEQGRRLVMQGDAARGIPACVACHGAALTGVAPSLPGLLGLPRDYLVGQFGGWLTGQRRAEAPDCMAEIARRLAPADITAVASWLAAQPVPAGGKPADTLPAPPPLKCGGGMKGGLK
jgi:cytochrome c553